MKTGPENITVTVSETIGKVSGIVMDATDARFVLVLAHGAGAGMSHPFMESLAKELAARSVATLRYNFPYMEKKQGRPDPPAVAEKTVGVLIGEASRRFPALPLFAGGKSFGGRMTSQYISKAGPLVSGLIFYGFPLHPLGAPSTERANHLNDVQSPMLFLLGTRDKMAEQPLIKSVIKKLRNATLSPFEGADHSFKAGKENLIPELAERTVRWMESVV